MIFQGGNMVTEAERLRKRLSNTKILGKIRTADDLYINKQYDEALGIYNELLKEIDISYAYDRCEVIRKIGNVYYKLNNMDEACKYYEKTLSYCTTNQSIYTLLGTLFYYKDREKSLKYYMKALDLKTDVSHLITLNLSIPKSHNYNQKQIKEIFEHYIDIYRPILLNGDKPFIHSKPDQGKKLNIGYHSSDFSAHAMMSFILPLLENHDIEKYNFTLYSTSAKSDIVTDRIKNTGMKFIDCKEMSNKQLAQMIYDDKIDILVDLCGYSNQRLFTLLYKPAPIQMQYLGFLNTYGMKEVDYIFADKFTIPENMAKYYTEKPFYIDCGMQRHDFNTANMQLPELTQLPYNKNGYITFGSFNTISKINEYCISLWSKLLKNVENSKILIYRTQMKDRDIDIFKESFKKFNIDDDRLIFVNTPCPGSYLNAYALADIALDPAPFSGLTITIEQIAMGVPTVGLAGDAFQSKGAARINKMLGFDELAAFDGNDYVQKLQDLANNIERLEWFRKNLRTVLNESALRNDLKNFVRTVENGYDKIWQEYCKSF